VKSAAGVIGCCHGGGSVSVFSLAGDFCLNFRACLLSFPSWGGLLGIVVYEVGRCRNCRNWDPSAKRTASAIPFPTPRCDSISVL